MDDSHLQLAAAIKRARGLELSVRGQLLAPLPSRTVVSQIADLEQTYAAIVAEARRLAQVSSTPSFATAADSA